MNPGMNRLIPILIILAGACLLIGWAVAYHYDRKARARDRAKEEADTEASGDSPTPD